MLRQNFINQTKLHQRYQKIPERTVMKHFITVAIFFYTLASLTQAQAFVLQSPDVPADSTIEQKYVFSDFGCTGQNISPALTWSGVPEGAKSFALIAHDLDAVTGVGGFTHWIVYNIPVSVKGLEQGAGTAESQSLPVGSVQPATSFGTSGWGGPCPPVGDKPHRYEFTLYALGVERLELPENASQAFVGFNINGNALAKASFAAFYSQ
jgi:Raf kinase inhibitor-like YbhB/YbcL family protein